MGIASPALVDGEREKKKYSAGEDKGEGGLSAGGESAFGGKFLDMHLSPSASMSENSTSVSIVDADSISSDLRPHTWPVFLAGMAAFGVPLGLYLLTLAPTVTLEDSGSFIAAAYHLGVAHPPGYPLWCLLAHGFTWLPLGNIAQRVHCCSAVFAAATTLMTFGVAWRLTRHWGASLVAALALGFSRLFWSQAVIAEVYTLNAFLAITSLYFVIRWREQPRPRWLYGLSITLGLGLTNHLSLGLIAPVLAGWLLIPYWRRVLQVKTLILCLLLFLAGLSVYAYLPIRARANPPVNWDNPQTIAKTLRHILRRAYYTEMEQVRYSGQPKDQLRHCLIALKNGGEAFTWPMMAIACLGIVYWSKYRRDVLLASLCIVFMNIIVLNILLKAPSTPRVLFIHRVFYIPAHIIMALWIAAGCAWLLEQAQQHLPSFARKPCGCRPSQPRLLRRRRLARGASRWGVLTVSSAMAMGLTWMLAIHTPHNNRSQYWLARNLGLDFLDSAPQNAGLLLVSDNVLFVCNYLKLVEGLRPDVQILDPFFGYKGGPISAVISDMPVTPELIKCFPVIKGAAFVPWGLGYRLIKANQIPPATYQSLRPLPHPPHDPGDTPDYDPYEVDVRARYACYHARLGAKLTAERDTAGAQREFAISETLKKDDPYACYLLATIYHCFGWHRERVEAMLEEALALLNRHYDPADYRFYPVTRQEIERELIRLGTSPDDNKSL